jgi:hypothetical protein
VSVDRDEAVMRLRADNHRDVAERISCFSNKRGNSWGWDGHLHGIAKRENRPELIEAVWGWPHPKGTSDQPPDRGTLRL